MEVQVGEVESVVRTTDAQTLLSPALLERIVRVVLERVRQEQAHASRVADERRVRPAVSADEASNWE